MGPAAGCGRDTWFTSVLLVTEHVATPRRLGSISCTGWNRPPSRCGGRASAGRRRRGGGGAGRLAGRTRRAPAHGMPRPAARRPPRWQADLRRCEGFQAAGRIACAPLARGARAAPSGAAGERWAGPGRPLAAESRRNGPGSESPSGPGGGWARPPAEGPGRLGRLSESGEGGPPAGFEQVPPLRAAAADSDRRPGQPVRPGPAAGTAPARHRRASAARRRPAGFPRPGLPSPSESPGIARLPPGRRPPGPGPSESPGCGRPNGREDSMARRHQIASAAARSSRPRAGRLSCAGRWPNGREDSMAQRP